MVVCLCVALHFVSMIIHLDEKSGHCVGLVAVRLPLDCLSFSEGPEPPASRHPNAVAVISFLFRGVQARTSPGDAPTRVSGHDAAGLPPIGDALRQASSDDVRLSMRDAEAHDLRQQLSSTELELRKANSSIAAGEAALARASTLRRLAERKTARLQRLLAPQEQQVQAAEHARADGERKARVLQVQLTALQQEHVTLQEGHAALRQQHTSLGEDHGSLREQHMALRREHVRLLPSFALQLTVWCPIADCEPPCLACDMCCA